MRILYHHRTRATDAQRVHIREIIRAFRQLGHQVDVAALADAEQERADAVAEASEGGWKTVIRAIPFAYECIQLAYNAMAAPWLLWKVYRGGADFIYERYSLFNFAGVIAARLSGRPIVVEVNAPLALELSGQGEIRAVRLAHWAERVICNGATRVVVVSGPLGRILKANGVRENKLLVIPNGVDPERLRDATGAEELRTALGLERKLVIGFVGWFRKWHGLEFLVRTFHQAELARCGARLLLVGDGPGAAEVKAYTHANGLTEDVIFTGPIPHERIPPYLNLIDVAVQPAAVPYCCPMKIVEYMALGKAIVAPRQENIEELVSDGHEGLLFKPGDSGELGAALTTLVMDAAKRTRLGDRALEAIHERGLLWIRNAETVTQCVAEGSGCRAARVSGPAL